MTSKLLYVNLQPITECANLVEWFC